MIKEYDVIKAKKDLSTTIHKGCKGTIVMVYDDPRLAYEVEFFSETGETIDVITVEPEEIVVQELDLY